MDMKWPLLFKDTSFSTGLKVCVSILEIRKLTRSIVESPLPRAEVEQMIDHALLEDDINNDGKISWEEYLASQQYHHNL